MSTIYLAGQYSRREELCGYRAELEATGHTVTSRWLNGDHAADDGSLSDDLAEQCAVIDFDDVQNAAICIVFLAPPEARYMRGGHLVEFGIALGLNRYVIAIGNQENIFTRLPWVTHYPDWRAFWHSLAVEGGR